MSLARITLSILMTRAAQSLPTLDNLESLTLIPCLLQQRYVITTCSLTHAFQTLLTYTLDSEASLCTHHGTFERCLIP
jgi:hypothetical protein